MSAEAAFRHVSEDEKELLRAWRAAGKSIPEMARLLGRDRGTVSRQLRKLTGASVKDAGAVGRPAALSEKDKDHLVKKVGALTKAADARFQVTLAMVMKAGKFKCCEHTLMRALHERGVYMHPLREKPARTDADEAMRREFAREHQGKPCSFWVNRVDAYLDNKNFPVYLNAKMRAYGAKRAVRGTFRGKGGGLAKGHVKPRKNLKMNTGAPSVQVSAAISGSGVLMWHAVVGNWRAQEAVRMYGDGAGTSAQAGPADQAAVPHRRGQRPLRVQGPRRG